jgi:hypothetical protein
MRLVLSEARLCVSPSLAYVALGPTLYAVNDPHLCKQMAGLQKFFNDTVQFIVKDRDMAEFLVITVFAHALCYTLENSRIMNQNIRIQLNKVRTNNIEKLQYFATSVGVFVIGAQLGFNAGKFIDVYRALRIVFAVYIASLVVSFICNWLCAMKQATLTSENGFPPETNGTFPPVIGENPSTPVLYETFYNLLTGFPVGEPILSPTRRKFLYWFAQYLLVVCNQIQTVMLSYFSFGFVGAYTVAYPLGLLSRSLQ